jgi:hypothetical protein
MVITANKGRHSHPKRNKKPLMPLRALPIMLSYVSIIIKNLTIVAACQHPLTNSSRIAL